MNLSFLYICLDVRKVQIICFNKPFFVTKIRILLDIIWYVIRKLLKKLQIVVWNNWPFWYLLKICWYFKNHHFQSSTKHFFLFMNLFSYSVVNHFVSVSLFIDYLLFILISLLTQEWYFVAGATPIHFYILLLYTRVWLKQHKKVVCGFNL